MFFLCYVLEHTLCWYVLSLVVLCDVLLRLSCFCVLSLTLSFRVVVYVTYEGD